MKLTSEILAILDVVWILEHGDALLAGHSVNGLAEVMRCTVNPREPFYKSAEQMSSKCLC